MDRALVMSIAQYLWDPVETDIPLPYAGWIKDEVEPFG